MDDNLPSFFNDSSNINDRELLLDYFLSWTLRCAKDDIPSSQIRKASRNILTKLLEIDTLEGVKILELSTWKQWERVDLLIEVQLDFGQEIKWHTIIIENKMYSHVNGDQLVISKQKVRAFYEKYKPDYTIHYWLITCLNNENEYGADLKKAELAKYNITKFSDLKNWTGLTGLTGNYLFDEFWIRYFKTEQT